MVCEKECRKHIKKTACKSQNVLRSCLAWPLHRAHNGAHSRVGVELVGGDGRGRGLVRHPACSATVWVINCYREMKEY